jgi:ABC-type phosphate transport system permease subunit
MFPLQRTGTHLVNQYGNFGQKIHILAINNFGIIIMILLNILKYIYLYFKWKRKKKKMKP